MNTILKLLSLSFILLICSCQDDSGFNPAPIPEPSQRVVKISDYSSSTAEVPFGFEVNVYNDSDHHQIQKTYFFKGDTLSGYYDYYYNTLQDIEEKDLWKSKLSNPTAFEMKVQTIYSYNESKLQKEVQLQVHQEEGGAIRVGDTLSIIEYGYEDNLLKVKSFFDVEMQAWLKTFYEYNSQGQLIKETQPYDGSYKMFQYDSRGLVTEELQYTGYNGTFNKKTYVYDDSGYLQETYLNDNILYEKRIYDGNQLKTLIIYNPNNPQEEWIVRKYQYL